MQWPRVLESITQTVKADAILVAVFPGGAMRMTGTGKHVVPLLEWMLIGDSETENWAPCTVQFDLWHADLLEVARAEARLRVLYHTALPIQLGGVTAFSQYVDGTVLASPDRDGYVGRAIRFRFTPLNSRSAL